MKNKLDIVLRILGVAMIFLLLKLLLDFVLDLSQDRVILLIGVVGAIGIVFASVKMILMTIEHNFRIKNELEIQRTKMEYYDDFLAAFSDYTMMDKDAVEREPERVFYSEVHRLLLYASQEVLECVEQMKLTKDFNNSELYDLIRKDLASKEYKQFEHLRINLKPFWIDLKKYKEQISMTELNKRDII